MTWRRAALTAVLVTIWAMAVVWLWTTSGCSPADPC